jgi:hypothetical protein
MGPHSLILEKVCIYRGLDEEAENDDDREDEVSQGFFALMSAQTVGELVQQVCKLAKARGFMPASGE